MSDWKTEIEPLKESVIAIIRDWSESGETQEYSWEYVESLFEKYLGSLGSIEQKRVGYALLETKIFNKILLENKEEDTFYILTLEGSNLREDEVLEEGVKENFSPNQEARKITPQEASDFIRKVESGSYDKFLRIS